MAEIIDLDFYRKFRVILPVRPRGFSRRKPYGVSRVITKRYRRRQKGDQKTTMRKKD